MSPEERANCCYNSYSAMEKRNEKTQAHNEDYKVNMTLSKGNKWLIFHYLTELCLYHIAAVTVIHII